VAFTLLPGDVHISSLLGVAFLYITWHFTCPNYSW